MCRAGTGQEDGPSKGRKSGHVATASGLTTPGGRTNHTLTGNVAPDLTAGNDVESPEHKYGRIVYTREALEGMTLKSMKDICRQRGIAVSGKKPELIERLLTSQLAPYPNGAPGP